METFIEEYYKQVSRQLERAKNEEFENKLAELGFVFNDNEERQRFCETRLKELSFEDKHPDYRELWLDIDSSNRTLICTYWDRYNIRYNTTGDQITVTVTWNEKPEQPFTYKLP